VNHLKVAVLGAGAMGSLFGAYLSNNNDVWLIDIDIHKVDAINKNGITVIEKDGRKLYRPKAVCNSINLDIMDLIIIFVKSMYTLEALEQNKHLINDKTYLLTLQNGAGHESKLMRYANKDRVIIGTTQHNSFINQEGHIVHGGGGKTVIGLICGDSSSVQCIADNFSACGIQTYVSSNIKKDIWEKLFLNTSASSLTAVLQVPLGFIYENRYANFIMKNLAHEAVETANTEYPDSFNESEVIKEIETVLSNSRDGYTSIYMDLKNGLRTEVDTISGYVLEVAKREGIFTPFHECIVSMIHALEDKSLCK